MIQAHDVSIQNEGRQAISSHLGCPFQRLRAANGRWSMIAAPCCAESWHAGVLVVNSVLAIGRLRQASIPGAIEIDSSAIGR